MIFVRYDQIYMTVAHLSGGYTVLYSLNSKLGKGHKDRGRDIETGLVSSLSLCPQVLSCMYQHAQNVVYIQ